jgi:hypothetical protein
MALSGFAKLLLACPEEAISLLRCSIEINRNYPLAHFWLAAALCVLVGLTRRGLRPKLASRLARVSR